MLISKNPEDCLVSFSPHFKLRLVCRLAAHFIPAAFWVLLLASSSLPTRSIHTTQKWLVFKKQFCSLLLITLCPNESLLFRRPLSSARNWIWLHWRRLICQSFSLLVGFFGSLSCLMARVYRGSGKWKGHTMREDRCKIRVDSLVLWRFVACWGQVSVLRFLIGWETDCLGLDRHAELNWPRLWRLANWYQWTLFWIWSRKPCWKRLRREAKAFWLTAIHVKVSLLF